MEEVPSVVPGKRIIDCDEKRMARGQPIVECERARPRLPARFGDHVPLGLHRAGDVAAFMQEQDHAVRISSRCRGRLGGHVVSVNALGPRSGASM